MSSQSALPKERVNIRYQNNTLGHSPEQILPLKLLAMGPMTLKNKPLKKLTYEVSRHNLDNVMAQVKPSVDIQLNFNDEHKEMLKHCQINPESQPTTINAMSSFHPGELIENIPTLKQLTQVRQALISLKSASMAKPQLLDQIKTLLKSKSNNTNKE